MSRKPDLQDPPPRLPPEKAEEVLVELERVLVSPLFRASRRCHTLLRRITELTLTGDFDSLKERALGIEVFGRYRSSTKAWPFLPTNTRPTGSRLERCGPKGEDPSTRIGLDG